MDDHSDAGAAGLAALSICESLLLALGDLKTLSAKDIDDVLDDVAEAHCAAANRATGTEAALHRGVVAQVERIRVGGNSGSRPDADAD
jgi:hypothetical protein